MSKMKVLIPLDGSEKSMHSIDWLKKFFSHEDVEVTLMVVTEVILTKEIIVANLLESIGHESEQILDNASKMLEGYDVTKLTGTGRTSNLILREASDGNYHLIIMTKSSVKGISRIIGSVTSQVVRDSEVSVVVVPE
jgi:nucleotide-binding universal stress UspA family protein